MRDLANFTTVTWEKLKGQENDATPKRSIFNDALYEPLLPKGVQENLRQAIENCNLEQIKKMVDEGVDINAAYPSGMHKKDAKNVFKKLKILFSDIKVLALLSEIKRLEGGLTHSEKYKDFIKLKTALMNGHNFSEKQPVEIVAEIMKNIEMALSIMSYYPSCKGLKLDKPNAFSSIIFKKFGAFLTGTPATRKSTVAREETDTNNNDIKGSIELAPLQAETSGKEKKKTNRL